MKLYVCIILLFVIFPVAGQQLVPGDISIEAGETELPVNEPFILSVVVKNSPNRPSLIFPNFDGLEKRSASATTTTSTINGKTILIQTISQQYIATKPGEYELSPFTISVDGVKVRSRGMRLTFNKVEEAPLSTDLEEPEKDFSAGEDISDKDIFLSIKVSRPIVYLRQGFALRLSLYVARSTPVEMEFYQLDTQLQSILKAIRPATCWEENVGIEEVIQREVTVGGRKYTEYQMYRAMFFPITLQTVSFPAVGLQMLFLTTRPNQDKKQREVKTFYSRPVRVLVKPLPKHPAMDHVSVGQYILREELSQKKVLAGGSLRYSFTVAGEGNLATVSAPEVPSSKTLDFYPPDVSQTVQRDDDKVSGKKTFDYFIVAKQKGTFPLGRFFQWIYYDPVKARYDTLRSSQVLEVVGENLQTSESVANGTESIYEDLESLDTNKKYIDYQQIIMNLTSAIVVGLLGVMVWIFRK